MDKKVVGQGPERERERQREKKIKIFIFHIFQKYLNGGGRKKT